VTGSDKQSLLVSAHGHSKVFILSRSHLELPSCPTTVVRYTQTTLSSRGGQETTIVRACVADWRCSTLCGSHASLQSGTVPRRL
jgi:hypothetical protein